MTAFAAANAALFSDRNMAEDVVYRRQGLGPDIIVRGILSAPDETTAFSDTQLQSQTTVLTVQVSAVAEPADGDRFLIADEAYVVMGTPQRDVHRLTWRIVLVPEDMEE
jgi:hypothetical protein